MGQLRINPTLETLLAPALLPRGALNQQLLLALREVRLGGLGGLGAVGGGRLDEECVRAGLFGFEITQ